MADGPTTLTYSSLLTDLKNYVERGGVLDPAVERQLPRIINNAERDLADRLKIQGYIQPMISTMSIGEPRLAKPTGWRSTVSINVSYGVDNLNRRTLRNRSLEYIRGIFPNDNQKDLPRLYADYDLLHWLLGPAPNIAYQFEAICWMIPDLLCPDNEENYLTVFAPNLLLYTCLEGVEAFLKNDARTALWTGYAQRRFDAITGEDVKRMRDRAQRRTET